MIKITYFDFCDIGFSSYFLNGLIKLASERKYQFRVSQKAPVDLKDIEEKMRINWLWKDGSRSEYAVFRYQGDEDFLFCIDASDRNGDIITGGIHPVLLERCRYYYKVNYNAKAIKNNPSVTSYAQKILPLPLVFQVEIPQRWRFLPNITGIGGHRWPSKVIKQRLRQLLYSQKIDQYRKQRQINKDLDVFFLTYLYPKAWNRHYADLNLRRLEIVDGLNMLSACKTQVGYVYFSKSETEFEQYVDKQYRSKFEQYRVTRISRSKYLDNMSRSRLGIYVRGADECLSFKFGELLALGKPIVGETLFNNKAQLYTYPRFSEQFAFDDSKALLSRVAALLESPHEMQELGEINGKTFDDMLAPKPIMSGVLDQLTRKF